MADLTLYTNPMSRGRMARWMLEEMGLPYRAVILDYGTTMKAPDYLAINPMGKVPALRHGETIVTECAAVISYLAFTFPECGLLPDDRGHFLRWMFFGAGPVDMAATLKGLGYEPPAERRGLVGFGHMDDVVAALLGLVAAGPWLAGERFSALDVYLGSQIGWGVRFGTLPAEPAFTEYAERIFARPAARRAREIDDALVPRKD
ncbi:MAG TPA: glutathione S-transferase family protein [Paracoccaceae bacterium]|nr:glutathione S-transferase family protein [Paracoccaceae bacterium]HMO72290.1 glutathione S-transferase family protein [Paracoccaceae bacterium]